jgi:hypothetical protein
MQRLVVFLLLLLTFGCKGTNVMSEENISQENNPPEEVIAREETPAQEPPSIPALEQFILKHDEYKADIIPRKLSPPEVAKWINGRVDKNADLWAFRQTEKVADFYDTNEIVGKFKSFLDRKEGSEEEIKRSTVIARIVGRLGRPEDVEYAVQYYHYLIQRAETIEEFQDLIILHEVLGLGGNSNALRQKIQSKLDSLQAKKEGDYKAQIEFLSFKGKINNSLMRAEKVQAVKEKILRIPDRNQRLEEEIKAYLTIEYGFLEFLQPWAAMRIRRETWAPSPEQQIIRNDQQPLKGDVVKAFRAFLEKLNQDANVSPADQDSMRLRVLRAIRFFGGNVSEEEQTFLDVHKGVQLDILANEGFLLE